MYLTEREILSQQEAMEESLRLVLEKREQLQELLREKKRFLFLGCGSSYMLCKTGQSLFGAKAGVSAMAVAGGDYLLHPEFYEEALEETALIVLSRSGMTTEVVRAVEQMKAKGGMPVLSVTMKEQSALAALSDLALVCPWAFDESVCQTRTVSNFYEILLLLWAIYSGDEALLGETASVIGGIRAFLESCRPGLEKLSKGEFEEVVVLAGGPLCGLAEEAALAFTEIAFLRGSTFPLLDYRHGPKVLSGKHTLTIAALSPGGEPLQRELLAELCSCGGRVIALCPQGTEAIYSSDLTIPCPGGTLTRGFFLIAAAQLMALLKAVEKGIDPDHPQGLAPCILL